MSQRPFVCRECGERVSAASFRAACPDCGGQLARGELASSLPDEQTGPERVRRL